jgi:hypothetical protein
MTTDRKPRWLPYLEMLELMATANEKAGKKTPDYFPKAIGTNGARTILSIEPSCRRRWRPYNGPISIIARLPVPKKRLPIARHPHRRNSYGGSGRGRAGC